MRLIFLDMDGVLNSTQSAHLHWRTKYDRKTFMQGFDDLCPIAVSNLNWLLERVPDARIVISSTWRKFHEIEEWHEKMATDCPSIVGRVIGKTPNLRTKLSQESPIRGHEIYKWLEDNGHLETPYVVFDDDRDMDKVESNFIWIDGDHGLQFKHIMEVFVRWGASPS